MAVGDVYRVAIEQKYNVTQDIVNVLHFRADTSIGTKAEEMEALADAVAGWWKGAYFGTVSSLVKLVGVKVRDVADPMAGFDLAENWDGTAAGDALMPQAAMEVLWRGPNFLRRARGRTWFSGFTEGAQVAGVWGTAHISAMQPILNDLLFINDVSFGGVFAFELGVWSRTYNEFNPSTQATIVVPVRNQQRRSIGFGS